MKGEQKIKLISSNQEEINRYTYAKAPTISEIDSFLELAGITQTSYERMVGMRRNTIYDVRIGYRNLPVKYWHLIYNKIVPSYGQNMDKLDVRTKQRKAVYNTNQNTTNSESILGKLNDISQP